MYSLLVLKTLKYRSRSARNLKIEPQSGILNSIVRVEGRRRNKGNRKLEIRESASSLRLPTFQE